MECDIRSYCIGGLRMTVHGRRLCQALDELPGMEVFADGRTADADIDITDATAPKLQGGRQVFAFDLNELRGECRMSTDSDGNVEYGFDSGSVLVHDFSHGGRVYLNWCGDLAELRFMLWLGYAHVALRHGAVPVHSSTVVWHDRAVLCLGESGTGKSTHTRLWRENIEGAWLLNDDSPIVRVEGDKVWVYGSPWSGKLPCFRQERVEVAALLRLSQAPHNRIARQAVIPAFTALQPSCPPSLMHEERCTDLLVDFIGHILERVPVYRLECLPDADAARLSCSTLFPRS